MRKQDDKGKLNKNYTLDLAGVTTMEKTTISIKKQLTEESLKQEGNLNLETEKDTSSALKMSSTN